VQSRNDMTDTLNARSLAPMSLYVSWQMEVYRTTLFLVFAFLGFCASSVRNWLLTFRNNISVASSSFK